MKPTRVTLAALLLTLAAAATTRAQDSGFGPLDPTPPAGMTPQQIVEKFAARESVFAQARENYTFRQTVKVDTITEDSNRVDGEYQQVTDITFNQAGKREEHVVFAPQNTLQRVMMSPVDFDEIEHRLPFILTTEDQPKYKIDYLGRQHVDELDTYVFAVTPKAFEKNKHYFQGKVWVDQQDYQIVLINGMTVPQDTRKGHEDLQPPFTTYYEQVDGKYWFPTYTTCATSSSSVTTSSSTPRRASSTTARTSPTTKPPTTKTTKHPATRTKTKTSSRHHRHSRGELLLASGFC
jgi:hypothetical protein